MNVIGRIVSVIIVLFFFLFGMTWLLGISIFDFMPVLFIIVAFGIFIVLITSPKGKPSTPKGTQPAKQIIRERDVITREVVMIPCAYCGSLMPQTATFCPNCGARRKA